MNKKDLIDLKKMIYDYYKKTPRKLHTSTLTVGIIDILAVASTINVLLENNLEPTMIIRSLLTTGIATGTFIGLMSCQKNIKKEENNQNKTKVRKR